MEPTLHGNELMMLVKVGKIDRYDIIVANYEKEHLIKRVYAFPGETIECIDGKILVNNKVIKDCETNKIRVNYFDKSWNIVRESLISLTEKC